MRGPIKRAGRVTGETARRITGISIGPLGGVQWSDPGPPQRELVRQFLVALEDRRVLYNPMQLEVRSQVDYSIHQIREACTKTLQQLGEHDFGVLPIRAAREACRRYHDDANLEFRNMHFDPREHDATAGFFMALGAFRATVGYQVALLAAHYDLDVEGDLASVLPDLDRDEA
jgi:hypothetical protein